VGMTSIGPFPERTPLSLATEAFKLALDDAGMTKDEIDGMIALDFGADYDRFLEAVGVDVNYAFQGWHHGRFLVPLLIQAALVIDAGLAKTVALVHGTRRRKLGQPDSDDEMWRQGLGPHGESPAHGAVSRAYGAAIAAQRYFHMYGGGNESLAPIAVTLRHHASLNPGAYRREPITIEDHQASRWVVEPLRLLDCCQTVGGGSCIIISSADRARDCRKTPVSVVGMQGVHAGPQYHNLAQPGLGVGQQKSYRYTPDDLRAYEIAGVSRQDIDGLTVYDAFTPLILFSLERWGFCGPGEAMDFVKDGRISIGGELPINTSGGLHSEGHLGGWNLVIEMVRQLRWEAVGRQIADCQLLQWGSFLGESIILRRSS
jgi:acetyl-CoA acetyltransferase